MEVKEACYKLRNSIREIYEQTSRKLKSNISRGHLRSISTDIEDYLAIFISDILPDNFKVFLDPSIHADNKIHRPDLLVVNEENKVVALLEIKANMGWCRDASDVLDKMTSNHLLFGKQKRLICTFSKENSQEVFYTNPSLFLISLSDRNCNSKKHTLNKANAIAHNIKQYNLFAGEYNNLSDLEIEEFSKELLNLIQN